VSKRRPPPAAAFLGTAGAHAAGTVTCAYLKPPRELTPHPISRRPCPHVTDQPPCDHGGDAQATSFLASGARVRGLAEAAYAHSDTARASRSSTRSHGGHAAAPALMSRQVYPSASRRHPTCAESASVEEASCEACRPASTGRRPAITLLACTVEAGSHSPAHPITRTKSTARSHPRLAAPSPDPPRTTRSWMRARYLLIVVGESRPSSTRAAPNASM
jgi:hypothetical protein